MTISLIFTLKMLWVIFFYSFYATSALIAYNNARFEPFNPQFLRANITNVYSQAQCVCLCFKNSLCFTATYSGINQQCILYMARLDQGILHIMTTNLMTNVLNFEDRTLSKYKNDVKNDTHLLKYCFKKNSIILLFIRLVITNKLKRNCLWYMEHYCWSG